MTNTALALAAALLLALLLVTHKPGADVPATSPDLLAACAEDDPCWDCSTMGNRICGPTYEGN